MRTIVKDWHDEADVVIIGYGCAGAAAAIFAHDAGVRVLLLEKLEYFGGMSITSGGGIAMTHDVESAFSYLKVTCGGRSPDDILRRMAEGMSEIPSLVGSLAEAVGVGIYDKNLRAGATYHFPGHDQMGAIKMSDIHGFNGYPWMKGLRGGARLMKVMADNVERRGIRVCHLCPAQQLITREDGRIIGVVALSAGKEINIKALRAVVLACGGFEHNEEMKASFFEAHPFYAVTALGNTGDGILMAQQVGAKLWHMWMCHGTYGFKYPEFPIAFRTSISGPRVDTRKMPWIVVDRYGRRFMNEYPHAVQDTPIRTIECYDPERQEYPRIPCFLIFDEAGRLERPMAHPIFTHKGHAYEWSKDNSEEIKKGWILRSDSISGIANALNSKGYAKIKAESLEETVRRWNDFYSKGSDFDFDRPIGTMMPINTPPFYAMTAWPLLNNTQGGPAHDVEQRVIGALGNPIPGLYVAGAMSSIYGHLYLEGGNLTECLVGGRRAGVNAAAEKPWN